MTLKKSKNGSAERFVYRFNAADLVIVAALLIAAFVAFSGSVFGGKTDRDYKVTVTLTGEEARQMALSGISAASGSEVYLLEEEELLGKLTEAFKAGDTTMIILIKSDRFEKNGYMPGDKLAIVSEKFMTKNAEITGIEEVSNA